MQEFRHGKDDLIHIINGEKELHIKLKDFLTCEPKYKILKGKISHWYIPDKQNFAFCVDWHQSSGGDINDKQLNAYIANIDTYAAKLKITALIAKAE